MEFSGVSDQHSYYFKKPLVNSEWHLKDIKTNKFCLSYVFIMVLCYGRA
jgi:hypothetical protein